MKSAMHLKNQRAWFESFEIGSNLLKLVILSFVFVGMLEKSNAAGGSDSSGWVGVQGGMSIPNYGGTSARPGFGFSGGAKVGTEFGVGAYYLTSKKDETIAGSTSSFGYDLYGVMFGYFFEGEAKGVYLGALLGMTKLTTQSTVSGTRYEVSTSPMHYGAVVGFDKPIFGGLSLGGELTYVSIASSSGKLGSTSTNASLDAFSTLNAMGAVKFWF